MKARPTSTAAGDYVADYGLLRPLVRDALPSLTNILGPGAPERYADLLHRAQVGEPETDPQSLRRLIHVMTDSDPILRVVGKSLSIRAASFECLFAADQLTRCEP